MAQTVASRFGATLNSLLHRLHDWSTIKNDPPPADIPSVDKGARGSTGAPGLSLSTRFVFAASIVLCNGMALLGGWVVNEIEKGLLQASATEEAAYVQSIFEPVAASLVGGGPERQHQIALVDDIISKSAMFGKKNLTSVAVWREDGSVAYSTDKDLIGRNFPLTNDIQSAFTGKLRTNLWERRLLGIYRNQPNAIPERMFYAPLHDQASGKVIAVAEMADNAAISKAQLDAIRKRTWLVVGISTALMVLLLSGIVHQGSRTIDNQREELEHRYSEQALLAQTNQLLCERLKTSNQHGIELGEQLLRRIGMDLQNGPAQMLALALLRMDELKSLEKIDDSRRAISKTSSGSIVELVERATADALKEIRSIEAGLILPELRKLSPSQAIEKVIRAHEHLTGAPVERNFAGLPAHLPIPVSICIFRFVQIALADADPHEKGAVQRVDGFDDSASVTIIVHDEAPTISLEEPVIRAQELALRELRQRVESIGGTLLSHTNGGERRQLKMWLPYSDAAGLAV